jgi:hypothetical protein
MEKEPTDLEPKTDEAICLWVLAGLAIGAGTEY